ncbi:MAG: hypothetical protein NC911_05420 [Candidatus Omnitrophica bacterium]|nr:hypothetical protein [Candidatus Omnitrophota bacterium]
MKHSDREIIRDLAKKYREICQDPVMEERRQLWKAKNSLQATRILLLVSFGMHNVWCRELFADSHLACRDEFFRTWERHLKMLLFHSEIGDDWIAEPWLAVPAVHKTDAWNGLWGLPVKMEPPPEEGGAGKYDPPLKNWEMMKLLRVPHHLIDEEQSERNVSRLAEAIGEILPVRMNRSPVCLGFSMDISTHLGRLRGHEQIMFDMYDSPENLHRLLAFMRDGILTNQEEAEEKGDITLLSHVNQAMAYSQALEGPAIDSGPRKREDIWGYCAAQEFTLISPAMHDEFLLQYQLPILKKFGLTAYGCCENLTEKINILRQIPNLRIIAVTPTANVHRCAEQIGRDYVLSWRPNPGDMVGYGFHEARIRRVITDAMTSLRHCQPIIVLKDVETVQGEPERLKKWVRLVRELTS